MNRCSCFDGVFFDVDLFDVIGGDFFDEDGDACFDEVDGVFFDVDIFDIIGGDFFTVLGGYYI